MKHCQHLLLTSQPPSLDDTSALTDAEVEDGESPTAPLSLEATDSEALLRESGKLRVLLSLVGRYREEGHRTLIFSQSVKMLDLIAHVLRSLPTPFLFLRLDGSVQSADERQRRVEEFSSPSSPYSLFLLTTGVGGVGLNLTAACRCVIFDPSWNPAVDSQAVDRCYRIGQLQNVVVHRFMTCNTVEEVIYRKQIFKQGLFNAAVTQQHHQPSPHNKGKLREGEEGEAEEALGAGQARKGPLGLKGSYFTRQELREVFQLRDHRWSVTQRQLAQLHPPHLRRSYPQLEAQLSFLLQHKEEVFGLSDHDLLFNEEAPSHNNPAGAAAPSHSAEAVEEEEAHQRAKVQVSHCKATSSSPQPSIS